MSEKMITDWAPLLVIGGIIGLILNGWFFGMLIAVGIIIFIIGFIIEVMSALF